MEGEEKEMCQNCKRDIPCINYQMHTAHCARHITLCTKCDEPIPKREFDEHKCHEPSPPRPPPREAQRPEPFVREERKPTTDFQTKKTSLTKPAKAEAVAAQTTTPLDQICRFCKLEFSLQALAEHEDYCGSRTEQCPECSDYVMLREWDKHQSMRLYHELAKKPSSLVFKRDEETQPVQRSASGILSSSIGSYPTSHSSSFLSKETRPPFGQSRDFNALQSSRSMKHLTDYSGSSSLSRKWSQDEERENMTTNVTRKWSLVDSIRNGGEASYNSSSSRRDSYQSKTSSSTRITERSRTRRRSTSIGFKQVQFDDQEDVKKAEETWNTSVEEQERLFEQIQRQRRRSSSRTNEHQLHSFRRSSENLISFSEDIGGARIRSSSRTSRWEQFSSDHHRRSETLADHTSWTASPQNDSMSVVTAMNSSEASQSRRAKSASSRKSKSSIVDRILSSGDSRTNNNYIVDDDLALPDLLPFTMTSSTKEAKNQPTAVTRPSRRREKRNARPEALATPSASISVIDKYINERRSSNSRQQESYGFAGGAPSLRRQDSMSNLTNLQDEINSMLQTNSSSSSHRSKSKSRSYQSSTLSSNLSTSSRNETTQQSISRANYESLASSLLSEPPPRRRYIEGVDHTESHRENLRQMLCQLRKDPMDEDLEKCDGEYFPCEFCGDPYPVEYIMRHQLSCDLNPTPIQEGNGFDYSEIARRAAANLAMAREG